MALVRGNEKGTTHGLKVVRLVILAIMFGQAELSAVHACSVAPMHRCSSSPARGMKSGRHGIDCGVTADAQRR
jgi:hypothetical protein